MKPFDELLKIRNLTLAKWAENYEDDGLMNLAGTIVNPSNPKLIYAVVASRSHVSVSLRNRCPTWEEMCMIKDLFFNKDECCVQYHPREEDYVNNHPYCLHVWRPCEENLPTPPAFLVGIKGVEEEDIKIIADAFADALGLKGKDALKETPKKPIGRTKEGLLAFPSCSVCGGYLDRTDKANYCSNCGQKIDWSEEIEVKRLTDIPTKEKSE